MLHLLSKLSKNLSKKDKIYVIQFFELSIHIIQNVCNNVQSNITD